jgi:hypothetical protein
MTLDAGREPVFVLDSREKFKPLAVESVEAVDGRLVDADGADTGAISLTDLPPDGGRMNFPPLPATYEEEAERRFGNVGYRRVARGGGFTWVQYWLWYLYNPKRIFVTGEHEGDWEFVQVGYAGDQAFCVAASQHKSGGSRMWWDCERRDGHPVIYVALGSHANYFQPVDQLPEIGDDGDGAGATLGDIEWRDFGDWATWPGRWGNSTGEGRSPQSPGCQGERWNAPHRYLSKTRMGR